MLLTESLRQAALYLAHVRYKVPLSRRFVLQDIHVCAQLDALEVGLPAADVAAIATLSDLVHRGEVLSSLRIDLRFSTFPRFGTSRRGASPSPDDSDRNQAPAVPYLYLSNSVLDKYVRWGHQRSLRSGLRGVDVGT
ncbi:AfsA-related hotdog domain-containing protein [Rhodococcus sp. JVH1]|jgi:hypothetical protein|nr:hypothetical protein JVH1_8824 [Rhodococcus sp. JVH1]